jgi:hypothetical protein
MAIPYASTPRAEGNTYATMCQTTLADLEQKVVEQKALGTPVPAEITAIIAVLTAGETYTYEMNKQVQSFLYDVKVPYLSVRATPVKGSPQPLLAAAGGGGGQ